MTPRAVAAAEKQRACFQTGCLSDPRYLYILGGAVLVLCEAHGDEYELGLAAGAVPVYTVVSLGADVSVGNAFASCSLKVVGDRAADRTDVALRNLDSRLDQLRDRDADLTSILEVFVTCLTEEPLLHHERLGSIELVTALVHGLLRPDARTLAISLTLCDAVADMVNANQRLRRVWRLVAIALQEGPQQTG